MFRSHVPKKPPALMGLGISHYSDINSDTNAIGAGHIRGFGPGSTTSALGGIS